MEGLEILPAIFNKKFSMRDAYQWGQVEIYKFLEGVAKQPEVYGVTDASVKTRLIKICKHILRLSIPNKNFTSTTGVEVGVDYLGDKTLKPAQHIYRSLNQLWDYENPDKNVSKFKVREHLDSGYPYWSPYDLLGLFLSLMGPAPPDASKSNFFFPLTAVYGRWCVNIASAAEGGVGSGPAVFQCTWRRRLEGPTQYCLGASLAGQEARSATTGTWGDELKLQRYKLINSQASLTLKGMIFQTSAEREKIGKAGNNFGNCAETYPFLEIMDIPSKQGDTLHGLSLHAGYLEDPTIDVNARLMCPCRNCKFLIMNYLKGASPEDFSPDSEGWPPPPPPPQTRA